MTDNVVSRRVDELEALRGLAAFALLLHHVWIYRGGGWNPFFSMLWVGVPVFFVLSGYLLYRPFLEGSPGLLRYFRSRCLRVFPAYWVVLAAMILTGTSTPGGGSSLSDWSLIGIGPPAGWHHTSAWTLGIEVAFYLMLPLLAFAGRLVPIAWVLPVSLIALSCIWQAARLPIALPGFIGLFAIGMLIAQRSRLVPVFGILGALVLVAPETSLTPPNQVQGLCALSSAAVAGCVVSLLVIRGSCVMRVKPLVLLGRISYGVYLWQIPVLLWLYGGWHGEHLHALPVDLAAAIVFTLLAATASWVFVERHALALKDARLADLLRRGGKPEPHLRTTVPLRDAA